MGREREEFNIKLSLDYFSLEESGGMSVPLAANGIVLVAIGYEIAPSGDNHTTYMCGTEKKFFSTANMTQIVEQCREGCVYVYNKFPNKK